MTHIFDIKCLKNVIFVNFRMLPEAKIMKKTAIDIQTFAIDRRNYRFLLRDLDLLLQDKKNKNVIFSVIVTASAIFYMTLSFWRFSNILVFLKWQ